MKRDRFTFEISLSVLDHLGRNLYRSFVTVLGEAVSNSWDANANNVWIYIDKRKNCLTIKDDGDGMTADDFQDKFLKIGYSKRKNGQSVSSKGRPYIGRKGIGKLALLSCADKITVISKVKNAGYVGGLIDNSGLDNAITKDLNPSDYPLDPFDLKVFAKYTDKHEKGTIICFENIKEGIRNSFEFLKKTIALYFRFSLLDESFNIHFNDEQVTLDDLKELALHTEFLWNINNLDDPYVKNKVTKLKEKAKLRMNRNVKGFIASVEKPRHLKIMGTGEKVGIDLFVNGRLREKDILKHIPTDRVAVSYLYGQIHVNDLDDVEKDRFTSSREGIVVDDEKYKKVLEQLRKNLSVIFEDWDKWRLGHKKPGDPESERITRKERSSTELFHAVSEDFEISADPDNPHKKKVDGWVEELGTDATHNFTSYAECFISENLVRKHIQEKNISFTKEALSEIQSWKQKETQNKNTANVNIDIRKSPNETSYLSMDALANLVDKSKDQIKDPGLSRDAKEYKPIRDALMHTALLTNEAKSKLLTIKNNIKGRVKTLLSNE